MAQFLDGESEVGVGKRLVAEREVPPLRVKGLEAVGEHGAAQYHAVLELLGGDAALRLGGRFAIVARIFTRVGIAVLVMETGTWVWVPVFRAQKGQAPLRP